MFLRITQAIVLVLATVMLIGGCAKGPVKKQEALDGSVKGLDTIPFYPPGSYDFDSSKALAQKEQQKQAEDQERKRITESIRTRIQDTPGSVDMPDPWIPPEYINPAELPLALRGLPKDTYGYPDWVASVDEGLIKPKDSILADGSAAAMTFDKDILFEINDQLMANVLFSHEVHTYWLSCDSCHPSIFKPKAGSNDYNMYDIWNGDSCGKCHGKVAFQPKGFENCQRCHSVSKRETESGTF